MKRLMKAVLAICMFAGIAGGLTRVTVNRINDGCVQLADFYKLDKNKVDVLFIGSSHVYFGVNTCRLYDNYGIASYLLASPGQPVWISYYLLEEALKTQQPRLVVFDVYTLYRRESSFGSWENIMGMKLSLTKWNAVSAVHAGGSPIDRIGAFFAFPYYHTRYASLSRQDYENTKQFRYNGYKPEFGKIRKSELAEWKKIDTTDFDKSRAVTERAESYLRRLAELCRDRGIPLLFVNAPYLSRTKEKQQAFNYIRTIAQEYGLPFVDSCDDLDALNLVPEEDFIEPTHLNYYGSLKYTDYLAVQLQKYELPDRRGDDNYRHWEETSIKFQHAQLKKRELKEIHTLSVYMNTLRSLEDCVSVISRSPGGEAAVYEDGALVFIGEAGQQYVRHFNLGTSDLAVKSTGKEVEIFVGSKKYAYVEDGINIVVYDRTAGCVIDGVGFDQKEGFQETRTRLKQTEEDGKNSGRMH